MVKYYPRAFSAGMGLGLALRLLENGGLKFLLFAFFGVICADRLKTGGWLWIAFAVISVAVGGDMSVNAFFIGGMTEWLCAVICGGEKRLRLNKGMAFAAAGMLAAGGIITLL